MKKLKILFSLAGIFAVFSFANVSAMEKTPSQQNTNKQQYNKRKYFPIEVSPEFNLIVFDFLEEDIYGEENKKIEDEIKEFLEEHGFDLENLTRENLDSCIEPLIEFLKIKTDTNFNLMDSYRGRANSDNYSHYSSIFKFYNYLAGLLVKSKPRIVFDDKYLYERSKNFSGRVGIQIGDVRNTGFKCIDFLHSWFFTKDTEGNDILKRDPNDFEAFRAVKVFIGLMMKEVLKKDKTYVKVDTNNEDKKIDTVLLEKYVVNVNKNFPIESVFEDVKERLNGIINGKESIIFIHSGRIVKSKELMFDGSAEDFLRFYTIAYDVLRKNKNISNISFDNLYLDVFNPDNFKTIELSADGSKMTFEFNNEFNNKDKFKGEKILENYRLKLLNFQKYLKRPTKLSKTTRLDQISIIPLLYIRFKQQNDVFKYSDNKLQDLEKDVK